ncbi:MAG: hypothetical protein IJ018_04965 [Bacilli bacterium]|nr:hypothetical protein [Bacilli bacterium]
MEKYKIGIPNLFLCYEEGKIIKKFLEVLNFEVIVLKNEIIEYKKNICYQLNEFLANINGLKDICNYIINIKFDSIATKERGCSNFFASYDLINNTYDNNVLNIVIDNKNMRTLYKELIKVFSRFNIDKKELKKAYFNARIKIAKERKKEIIDNNNIIYEEGKKILILGHSYNIVDEKIMNRIKSKLNSNYNLILCDKFDREKVKLYSKNISIKTESKYIKESLGVIEMLKNNIDGIILISSDMCIFDNMLDEYIKRKYNIKYINLIIKNEFVNLEENLEVFYT